MFGNGGTGGNGGASQGGGIYLAGGRLDVTNVTIARNAVKASAGGAGGQGGSVSGMNGQPGISQPGQGGGVFAAGGTDVSARNSLFGLNDAADGPDFSGNFTTASHNFLSDRTGSNLGPANLDAHGNIVGSASHPIDPLLGPLANNGGPTKTMALLAGSPCLQAGTSTGAPATDQRGVKRDKPPDIGAFELETGGASPPRDAGMGREPADSDSIAAQVREDPASRAQVGAPKVGVNSPESSAANRAIGYPSDLRAIIAALELLVPEWTWF
jgi:hypothetical protein